MPPIVPMSVAMNQGLRTIPVIKPVGLPPPRKEERHFSCFVGSKNNLDFIKKTLNHYIKLVILHFFYTIYVLPSEDLFSL